MSLETWPLSGDLLLFWTFGTRVFYISEFDTDSNTLELSWRTIDERLKIPLRVEDLMQRSPTAAITKLLKQHDICVTGPALDRIIPSPYFLKHLLPRLFVYARTSPTQKEAALAAMKQAGYITMMVGDGTNDVGALKQAHVGVALLDGTAEDLTKAAKIMRERRLREVKKKQEEMMKAWGLPPPIQEPQNEAQRRQQGAINKLVEGLEDFDEPPVLKFGDASVAAPFTSKLGTIHSSKFVSCLLGIAFSFRSLQYRAPRTMYLGHYHPDVQDSRAELFDHSIFAECSLLGWNQVRRYADDIAGVPASRMLSILVVGQADRTTLSETTSTKHLQRLHSVVSAGSVCHPCLVVVVCRFGDEETLAARLAATGPGCRGNDQV